MTEKIRQLGASFLMDLAIKGLALAILPWSIWVTRTLMVLQEREEERFSKNDGFELRLQLVETERRIDERMDNMPPPEYRDRLTRVEEMVNNTRQELVIFEREFSKDFVRKTEVPRQ